MQGEFRQLRTYLVAHSSSQFVIPLFSTFSYHTLSTCSCFPLHDLYSTGWIIRITRPQFMAESVGERVSRKIS